MSNPVGRVVIGVDPHKLSATIEVLDQHEKKLGTGRFTTDHAGYTAMRTYASTWPDRVWAVAGANGAGRPLAQRLLEAGENVVDVPAKLAARIRLFDTGHNRKTDALDAHSVAVVGVRTTTLRVLHRDGELEAIRMLTDRREALTRRRVQTVCRLHALLAELLPGQAKKDLTSGQAKAMLASVRPRDIAGKTRRRIAAEELADLIAIETKMKKATAELKAMVQARQSNLMDIHGIGPVVAARILADVGDVARFADRNRFASWTGTAPLDASSGEQNRHRLSEPGTGASTTSSTSPRSLNCGSTPTAAPTTAVSAPPGRSRPRHCAASSDASPTPSTSNSSPTPPRLVRVREGTAGRLKNPARSTYPRTSTLRISHSRTRTPDATPQPHRPERVQREGPANSLVDNRGEPRWATCVVKCASTPSLVAASRGFARWW